MSAENETSPGELLYLAMSIGEGLLTSGAEVSRVEDTICRLCRAFGSERVDVFTITSSIVVSMRMEGEVYTQTRRIQNTEYNLHRLELLNQLSRRICASQEPLSAMEIRRELERIHREPGYSFPTTVLFYALVSSSFSIFFGGNLRDAAASALIGVLLRFLQVWLKELDINQFISVFLCSIAGGILAFLSVACGIGQSAEMISIGNIMLLIPGIAMTNGIRDMFSGNTISGLLRLAEALLLAVVIALAFVLTSILL